MACYNKNVFYFVFQIWMVIIIEPTSQHQLLFDESVLRESAANVSDEIGS